MTIVLLCVIAALGALCIIFLREARAANGKAKMLKRYWEEEVEARRKADEQRWRLEDRYAQLEADYHAVADIERGEDYVRWSLGLPPEDQEESTS